MKFAISNLAWDLEDEQSSLRFLRRKGITGVEIAPTKVWPEWQGLNDTTARRYATYMEDSGFEIPSLQSIFFGKNFGSIFDVRNHKSILSHLAYVADIAAVLGASSVIFGSPRLRQFTVPLNEEYRKIAVHFLYAATEYFHSRDIFLCLEPCSRQYQCDFINTHTELLQLIETLAHPGFGLHIDSGNLHETGELLSDIMSYGRSLRHFHISEPCLTGFQTSAVPHLENLRVLRKHSYQGWASIEMLQTDSKISGAGPWELIQKALGESDS